MTATSSVGAAQEKVQPIRLSSEISAIADQQLAYTPLDQAKWSRSPQVTTARLPKPFMVRQGF